MGVIDSLGVTYETLLRWTVKMHTAVQSYRGMADPRERIGFLPIVVAEADCLRNLTTIRVKHAAPSCWPRLEPRDEAPAATKWALLPTEFHRAEGYGSYP